MKRLIPAITFSALTILTTSCSVSGSTGIGKDYTVVQMEQMTSMYFAEYASNEKLSDTYVKEKRNTECVLRSLARAIAGPYASLRTEWSVDLTRECSMNVTLLEVGNVMMSNCVPGIAQNQDELAYYISHAIAHTLLEHSNYRFTAELPKWQTAHPNIAKDKEDKFSFKLFLRDPDGYNLFTRVVGLKDKNDQVLPYTQEQEKAADILALQMMAKAGFNPSAALVALNNLNSNDNYRGGEFYLEMHPHTPQDMEDLSQVIEKLAPIMQTARNSYGRNNSCM